MRGGGTTTKQSGLWNILFMESSINMKPFSLIFILLLSACKKEVCSNLTNKISFNDSCSNKIPKQSTDEIIYLCLIDSIAFTDAEKWRTYLSKCITLDSSSIEDIPSGKYKVLIGFQISEFGNAVNPIILNTSEYGFEKKALIIFNSYRGKWNLPVKNEKGNKIVYCQPIVFEIGDE